MKKILMFSLLMIVFLPLLAQVDGTVEKTDWVVIIVTSLLGIIEVVGRWIPSKFNGITGLVIDLLKGLSDYLNRDKK